MGRKPAAADVLYTLVLDSTESGDAADLREFETEEALQKYLAEIEHSLDFCYLFRGERVPMRRALVIGEAAAALKAKPKAKAKPATQVKGAAAVKAKAKPKAKVRKGCPVCGGLAVNKYKGYCRDHKAQSGAKGTGPKNGAPATEAPPVTVDTPTPPSSDTNA